MYVFRQKFRYMETYLYLCREIALIMSEYKIKVVLLDEALAFVRSLPIKVQEKIVYNYRKIENGLMSKELFKKLDDSEIWEFRTLYNGNCYRLFFLLGYGNRNLYNRYSWHCEENPEDPGKGNRESRSNKKRILQNQIVMAKMNMTSLDVLTNEVFGEIGTSKRDAMEKQLKEEVNAYFVGETIRKMRQAQNLTQEQLGERIGVQKAQISRLEKGKCIITLPTMSRIFQALGVATATLDLGLGGKIALW